MKICKKCGKELPLDMFYNHINGKDGKVANCKDCMNKTRRFVNDQKRNGTYVSKVRQPRLSDSEKFLRKEELKLYNKDYRKNNLEQISKQKKEYMDNIKLEGIAAYGSKCACCGESIIEFLTIEHINGRNPNEKRLTGKKAWAKAKSEGYPDTYTVLCFNCNCAKGAFGICPHQN